MYETPPNMMPDQKGQEKAYNSPQYYIMEAVSHPDFQDYPEGVHLLVFDKSCENNETQRQPVPIFDAREEDHRGLIAQHYSNYDEMGVVHGVGLYGAVWPVRSSDTTNAAGERVKEKLPGEKAPIYILPEDLAKVTDVEQIHDDFRQYFENEQAIKGLYKNAPAIHLIVPVKENTDISSVFITYPEDWAKKGASEEQHLSVPTISAFYWYDPDHERIAAMTKEYLQDGNIAISSFNKHGEQPAWEFKDLLKYIEANGCPFDYVVHDPLIEQISVGSSFVQIAPPLKGEDACWKVYRTGPTAIDKYLERIQSEHGYKVVEGATEAARKDELRGQDLDSAMLAALDAVLSRQQQEEVE